MECDTDLDMEVLSEPNNSGQESLLIGAPREVSSIASYILLQCVYQMQRAHPIMDFIGAVPTLRGGYAFQFSNRDNPSGNCHRIVIYPTSPMECRSGMYSFEHGDGMRYFCGPYEIKDIGGYPEFRISQTR